MMNLRKRSMIGTSGDYIEYATVLVGLCLVTDLEFIISHSFSDQINI
jgi:hypothetical protein